MTAWYGSAWLLLSFSPFPVRHPVAKLGKPCYFPNDIFVDLKFQTSTFATLSLCFLYARLFLFLVMLSPLFIISSVWMVLCLAAVQSRFFIVFLSPSISNIILGRMRRWLWNGLHRLRRRKLLYQWGRFYCHFDATFGKVILALGSL